jgi:hypothetical protein
MVSAAPFIPAGSSSPSHVAVAAEPAAPAPRPAAPAPRPAENPEVWRIESTDSYETYSNGLRVEKRFATSNRPRSYQAHLRDGARSCGSELRSDPAGIVFHSTESPQVPFESDHDASLKLAGEALLDYVRGKRAYNFVIDRFGRVYRVVVESDAANHAGHSVWADDAALYIDLNDSFLGVAFEARSAGEAAAAGIAPPQLRSAQALTEMLRGRYRILAENCVTHAQVSVNPANMRIGYHTDWASGFPFARVGLPDNYSLPLPAIWAFGFGYDTEFLRAAGGRMHTGVALGEERLRLAAVAANATPEQYRSQLKKRYRTPEECGAGFPRKGQTT